MLKTIHRKDGTKSYHTSPNDEYTIPVAINTDAISCINAFELDGEIRPRVVYNFPGKEEEFLFFEKERHMDVVSFFNDNTRSEPVDI